MNYYLLGKLCTNGSIAKTGCWVKTAHFVPRSHSDFCVPSKPVSINWEPVATAALDCAISCPVVPRPCATAVAHAGDAKHIQMMPVQSTRVLSAAHIAAPLLVPIATLGTFYHDH